MRKHNVFLSYSSADDKSRRLVKAVRDKLHSAGVKLWLDETELTAGEPWAEQIERGLENAEAFVFFVSPSSLTSQWMNFELGVAASRAAV